jgi:predicted phosphodiesterase
MENVFLQQLEKSLGEARRIGLLADSHGDYERTELAAGALLAAGAERLIHLGDFCDSLQESSWVAVMQVLQRHRILTVKGNNDFQVETVLKGRRLGRDQAEIELRTYLKSLQTTMVSDGLCFAHSLPYDSFRSFYEPVDDGTTVNAIKIFHRTPHHIMFCGHSHTPVLFRWRKEKVTREEIPRDKTFPMKDSERYIVVVGAVAEGDCALYDREKAYYQRIRLH